MQVVDDWSENGHTTLNPKLIVDGVHKVLHGRRRARNALAQNYIIIKGCTQSKDHFGLSVPPILLGHFENSTFHECTVSYSHHQPSVILAQLAIVTTALPMNMIRC